MAVRIAYVALIVIWSTTPLTLKWSTEGVSFVFAAASRMSLGFVCVMLVATWRGEHLRFDRRALQAYACAALGIYAAMITVYWGAQSIPSGWVAIVFGMTPLVTTALAAPLLGERSLTLGKVLALICGVAGLCVIFHNGLTLSTQAALGLAAVLVATVFHALSAVLIKRVNSDLPALTIVAGGLAFALGPYYLSWWLLDGTLPDAVPQRALWSILYLGVIATTVGFSLYYYVLKHQSPTQVALIAFVSPITALLLGSWLNQELITGRVVLGASLVLIALFAHEVLPALRQAHKRRHATASPIAAKMPV